MPESVNFKRKNGFSWPLDKAQIAAWIIILYFALAVFGSFCVSLNEPWSYTLGIIFGILLFIHAFFNIWCMISDPGEETLQKGKVAPQPIFDRQKHKHVIENQFCKICLIVVPLKTKHCRKCNKCVTDFDHHCIYLNNCIGGRNYKIFIMAIVSAFIGALAIFIIGLVEFIFSFYDIQYFLTKKFYNFDSPLCNPTKCDENSKFLPIFAPVRLTGWRAFIMITTILALVACILIGYLIGYHLFLKINNMSTFEHSVKLRQESEKKEQKKITSKTQVEVISGRDRTLSTSDLNEQNSFKLKEKPPLFRNDSLNNFQNKTEQFLQTSYTNSNFDFDGEKVKSNGSVDLYSESRNEDFHQESVHRTRRLFNSRSSHQNGLPCSNSDTQNNYFLVNEENEISHQSLTNLSNLQMKNEENDLYERKITSNIVRLPPLLPITNTRAKKQKNSQENSIDT
ncbi:unnamed protein product [Brachionus calyciflorus]|uniref:Palmitoyltransferase n=1 Tax=Brachionus calyciflorus TaxID=104777 RepID=A0A814GV21_9BILA|nr:unnamed protein product [Brachionus calyciflorus]